MEIIKILPNLVYNYLTVNHSENFLDPLTAANNQIIECVWSHLKMKILRKMHDTTSELLYRHLIKAWWRSVNPQNTFLTFLNDTKNVNCN
jgi:hypothetical protein